MKMLFFQGTGGDFFKGYDALVRLTQDDDLALPALPGSPNKYDAFTQALQAADLVGVSLVYARRHGPNQFLSFYDAQEVGWQIVGNPGHTRCTFWYGYPYEVVPEGWVMLPESIKQRKLINSLFKEIRESHL